MERQEFLMEVTEIFNGGANESLKRATILLIKDAIRNAARSGAKQVQLYARFNIQMDAVNGGNMVLPISSTLEYFRKEGFNAVDQGNGYVLISWE